MEFYNLSATETAKELSSDIKKGLTSVQADKNREKYGENQLKKKKKKGFFSRLLSALSEPTLIILEFAWIITVGVNIGKRITTGDGDLTECVGILVAILLSAFLTVIMEGKSEKAFSLLGTVYDNVRVKVIRDGKTLLLNKESVAVGDMVLAESGDKIIADGRLITSNDLTVDESMLTGESTAVKKDANAILKRNTPLAERKNSVYSGTFISGGNGSYIVTAVGEKAEIGKIAKEIQGTSAVSAPLNEKLNRLGKTITLIGGISAGFVFVLSIIRLKLSGNLDFFSVENAFIEAIVLIVAAVPEGLPTTAAISLSLNVLKLAKSNALIRKLVAAETVGCVSVICSDKTGTLTENRMTVSAVLPSYDGANTSIYKNSAINSTALIKREKSKEVYFGSATECALLKEVGENGYDYMKMRNNALIGEVIPFSSQIKYMLTEDKKEGVTYIKGAPEVIVKLSGVETEKAKKILNEAGYYQSQSKRVVAFAHKTKKNYIFDGLAVISDPVRADVKNSIENCFEAGIKVKMLTGDNLSTAEAIARELGLIQDKTEVAEASELENLSDNELIARLSHIKVIARSTPITKLKVVEALKKDGEVVAVTGDGVNDAPAIKHADIGIAMGSGSEITKEASDIVLLDDSFSTIVKAISFGRNIYRNFQRFITFQLSVNLTAMAVVISSLILGLTNPFNAVQLLWIDIIMDGPPALTLGMESGGNSLMTLKPVRRTDGIVTFTMLIRIVIHALFMATAVMLEYLYDFLGAGPLGRKTAIFSLFVMFQLFNAFNCRKVGSESIFTAVGNNKPMVFVFGAVFLFQILLVQVFPIFFEAVPLSLNTWIRIVLTAFTVIIFSETYKFFYRLYKNGQKTAPLSLKISNEKIYKA